MNNIIYRIEPIESPFFQVAKHNKRMLGKKSASTRKNRKRIAKPIKFSARFHKIHEWVRDEIS